MEARLAKLTTLRRSAPVCEAVRLILFFFLSLLFIQRSRALAMHGLQHPRHVYMRVGRVIYLASCL